MKQFFLNLLSAHSDLSSKRFAGLVTLGSTIILAFIAASQSGWVCPQFMFDGLLLVIGGLFGFNAMETVFRKNKATEVAPVVEVPPAEVAPVAEPIVDTKDGSEDEDEKE